MPDSPTKTDPVARGRLADKLTRYDEQGHQGMRAVNLVQPITMELADHIDTGIRYTVQLPPFSNAVLRIANTLPIC